MCHWITLQQKSTESVQRFILTHKQENQTHGVVIKCVFINRDTRLTSIVEEAHVRQNKPSLLPHLHSSAVLQNPAAQPSIKPADQSQCSTESPPFSNASLFSSKISALFAAVLQNRNFPFFF